MTTERTRQRRMHASLPGLRSALLAGVLVALLATLLPAPAPASIALYERDSAGRMGIIVSNNPLTYTDPLGLYGTQLSLDSAGEYRLGPQYGRDGWETLEGIRDRVFDLAYEAGDLAMSLTPGLNDGRDWAEAVTGRDLITGEEFDTGDRACSIAGVILGSGPGFRAIRSEAARSRFLKELAASGKAPSWMKPWLERGRVPPGHQVDHLKPLSIGGADDPSNMRLRLQADHVERHRRYRPWQGRR